MITKLDLQDIQGNIVKAYGRYGFPLARYIFYRVDDAQKGRRFVQLVTPLVTTSVPWSENSPLKIPAVAINIAFTYQGLKHLDVPQETLHGFPDEFSMGMKARRDIVGDTGPNHYKLWDPVWNDPEDEFRQHIHILIGINGKNPDDLESIYQRIGEILHQTGGVTQLAGHRGPNGVEDLPYQHAAAIPSGKEHFGYSDGISNAYFEGCGENPRYMIGGGKPTGLDPRAAIGWAPLAAGEFVLGHADESMAYPEAPGPPLFSRNGTYMVYRKLHENVGSFNRFIEEEGKKFGGKELFAAKLSGRWRNGAPITTFPTEESANRFIAELDALDEKSHSGTATHAEKVRLNELKLQLTAYDYNDDAEGSRCPFGAHIRRTNPRSALQFGADQPFDTPGALSNRRRLLRRGLPYGKSDENSQDDGDHGIILMIINTDLSRQFEFVQEQWLNYGNDFRLSNDQDPILGNYGINRNGRGTGRMMIEGDAKTGKPPYFCSGIPTLVETRGGDYFFIPSMTCLRMIAMGIVDPT
jgi:deferrochelatase/peroxidase EfeB